MNVLDWRGPEFLQLYAVLLALAVLGAFAVRWRVRQPGDDLPAGRLPELHPLEVAYLAGGSKAVTDVAIAALVHRGSLGVDRKRARLLASSLPPQDVTPLEESVYQAVVTEGGRVGPVRRTVRDVTHTVSSRLQVLGLVPTGRQALNARMYPALIFLALLTLGVLKIVLGAHRHRSVGFLVLLCFVTLVVAIPFAAHAPLRTRRGSRLLGQLRARNAALRTTALRASGGLAAPDLTMAFALFGAGAFATGPMDDLRRTLAPPHSGGSGCGSTSGCGSGTTTTGSTGDAGGSTSSCGSGGGGCGGCGGGGGD